MSAFFVRKETIDHVLTAYDELTRDDGRQIQDIEQFDQMGKDLWTMNGDALTARYGDPIPDEEIADYQYRRRPGVSRHQLYKSIQCLLYQCTEGDIPETNPLYKQLEDIGQKLAHKIVSTSTEYDLAGWDKPCRDDAAISLNDLLARHGERVAAGLKR